MPWVELLAADALPPGGVCAADRPDGTELVVWRTATGDAVVCEGRCPHQWSHLATEGVVDGEELVCTAHFWRFDAQGTGSKLNVLGRRDAKGDLAVFIVRVRDGMIEADLPS